MTKRYRVYGVVGGTVDLGTVEADTPEEAQEKAEVLATMAPTLCHQCSNEVDLSSDFSEVKVEEE